MVAVPLQLAATWIALMLVYLLGDVLRIFSGDMARNKTDTTKFTGPMWLGIAVLMLTPILMILVCVMAPLPANRWANIIVAGFFFVFNLVGLPTYPSAYDRFLLIISLGFNLLTIAVAWAWA